MTVTPEYDVRDQAIAAAWQFARSIGAQVCTSARCVFVMWERPSHFHYRIFYGDHADVHTTMDQFQRWM